MNSKIKNRLLLFALLFLIFQNVEAKTLNPTKDDCEEKNVIIKTELKTRYKYFFFKRTSHKKVKRIDKVINQNGQILMKIIMKSTQTNDYSWFRKFHRIVIKEEEIHEIILIANKEKGKLIIYNFCGKKIGEQNISSEELYDKYRF